MAEFQILTSLRHDQLLLESTENAELSGYSGVSCPLYMLRYHRDRLIDAGRHFDWTAVVSRLGGPDGLRWLQDEILRQVDAGQHHADLSAPSKVRVLFDRSGRMETQKGPTPPVSLQSLFPSRLEDPQPTNVAAKAGGAMSLGVDDRSHAYDIGPWTVVIPDTEPTKASFFTTFKTTRRDMYLAARDRVGITSYQEPQEVALINSEGHVMEGSFTNIYLFRRGRWVTPPTASGCLPGTARRWLLEAKLCREEVIQASGLVDQEECYLSNGVRGLFRGRVCRTRP